jgi:AraC family transcriptional regulator
MQMSTISYERPGVERLNDSAAFVRWVVCEKLSSSPDPDWRADKLKEFIDAHLAAERWSLDNVCKEIGLAMSARQARRLFKASIGMSVRKYAKNRRLAFAARQLEATKEPVKVIALEIGYRRTAEFTRSFKELFHLSPLEFRRIWSHRERAA